MLTNEQVAEILALATASTPCDGYGPITKSDAAGLADKTARLDGTAHYAKLWCSYLRIENDESLIAAITGNGPTSEVNARFYSCARGAVVSLVEALTAERQRAERAEAVHFGQAGHFCDADRCRFHLHTHVNGVCVSTVGEYFPSYSTGREPKTLNATSLYETMVFRLDESGEPVSWSEIDGDRYQTRDDANAGHVAMIERWRNRVLTSPVPPAGVEGDTQ